MHLMGGINRSIPVEGIGTPTKPYQRPEDLVGYPLRPVASRFDSTRLASNQPNQLLL